ncbi:MAG TPA: hypothetical protein VHQ43_04810 [Solirubrobacterales bacterium]|jgi:hypothetical protein|nr:hypothetical protein [Solirubrobacterales bacterium]
MKVELDKRVTATAVEGWIASFAAASPSRLTLDLTRAHRLELLAETRLLALLTMARRSGAAIDLVASQEIDVASRRPKKLVDLLSETIAGVILVQMATRAVDGSGQDRRASLVRAQAVHAVANDGLFGFGREHAAPVIDIFGGPPPASMVRDDSGIEFDPLFREWVSKMNLPPLQDSLLQSLIDFAYETFDNCRRHGARDLDRNALEGVRFVLLRTVSISEKGALAAGQRLAGGPIAEYLEGLAKDLGDREFLAELTVCDCGVGIPATLAGSTEIYDGPWEAERHETLDAFTDGRTSRRGISGVGRGLLKALRSTDALHGLIAVRTGRTQLNRSFLQQDNPWHAEELPWAPGTSVSLLFPWRDPIPTLFKT